MDDEVINRVITTVFQGREYGGGRVAAGEGSSEKRDEKRRKQY